MSFLGRALSLLGGALHADSWANYLTGFGTSRDKTEAGSFEANLRILDTQLSALYHHDDIAGRIVDLIPREMLRQGFGVNCSDPEIAKVIGAHTKDLDVIKALQLGHIWGRLFGGSVILLGADDGQDPVMRLDEDQIRSFTFLQVYDRRDVTIERKYENAESPRFGQPLLYRLQNIDTGKSSLVHESRVIRFRGAITGKREQNTLGGWDYSVLQRAYPAIRQFQTVYKAAELLITDASQGVFKIKGLLNMIAGGQLHDLQTRALFMDQCRSIARSIMLDSEGEDFSKVQTSFAGIGEMLDRSANRLAAASETPVTLLMGQAPAGLNATGASDIRSWYDRVQGDREIELRPPTERILRLIAIAAGHRDERPEIEFPPLWQETAKEKADREKVEADTAAVWINADVLTPEDVAVARFGGKKPQPYRIDPNTRIPNPALDANDIPGAKGAP